MQTVARSLSTSLLVFSLILSGCASLPPESKHAHITPELMAKYQSHQQALKGFSRWQASGKMALFSPGEKQSSRMNWQQAPQESRLTLTNLLGVTLLEAQESPQGALIKVEGKTHSGSSLQSLINDLTGYRMPVQAMPRWLTGDIDLALAQELALDDGGHLLNFKQTLVGWGNWQVSYNGYYPATPKRPALPSKITLKHPDLTIKLIIHKWN